MDKFIARTTSLSVEKVSCIRFSVVYIIFVVHWFYLGFISFVDFFFSVYCYVQMDGKKNPQGGLYILCLRENFVTNHKCHVRV